MDKIIRVLLVEDSQTDAAIALDALEQGAKKGQRFRVTTVKRLAAAIEALASPAFDAVMLDLDLPDSRGIATLSKLRDVCPGLPIIVCSGLENEDVALEALEQGAQEYLVKGRTTSWATRRTILTAIERKHLGKRGA